MEGDGEEKDRERVEGHGEGVEVWREMVRG